MIFFPIKAENISNGEMIILEIVVVIATIIGVALTFYFSHKTMKRMQKKYHIS